MARAHQHRPRRLPRPACIKGTRIPVAVVLDDLAAGLRAEEIVASYAPLRAEDVRAAAACAAELARERERRASEA